MCRWQKLASTVAVALGFGCVADYVSPQLRHINYVAIAPIPGESVGLNIPSFAHGYRPYQDPLKCRWIGSSGEILAQTMAEVGKSAHLDYRSKVSGHTALEVNSGWNLAQVSVEPASIPYAYRSGISRPLQTVKAWGPLYFFVPEGTGYFNVWIQASVTGEGLRYILRDPEGNVVRDERGDFDTRTKIQIKDMEGNAAAAWSIEILDPEQEGLVLDDVTVELGRHLPEFLTPKAEWAALFAGDWQYAGDSKKLSNRVPSCTATMAPYRPSSGSTQVLDDAYRRRGGDEWSTSLPFPYVLDYGSKHLGEEAYVPTVGTASPTLLHLGKDVPLNHGWGPVKALGGENQAYGYGDYITRLSPDEVAQRKRELTAMVSGLHGVGVRWVMPYICSMTLNGDPKRRSGFWEFYDHWDEYRSIGLGPRPATDPIQWLQTKADGTPQIYYGYKYPDEYYPPFKNNHRFAACWHTEGWRTWLLEVVRFLAECGYDGVFVDNGTSQRSTSPAALAAFRSFMQQRFTPEQLRDLFGVEDVSSMGFPTKKLVVFYAELQRFWCETLKNEHAAIKATGTKALGREFAVFPNGGRPAYIQQALPDTDFVMFEKSHGEYGTHPGMAIVPVFEGQNLLAYNDNIFEHVFVRSLHARVRPIILSRPGYPGGKRWLRMNQDSARLGFAECAAFSGGGGFLVRPRFDLYHDSINEYRAFIEKHPGLYAGLMPYAPVKVLAFPEQGWLGNTRHMGQVKELTRLLVDAHVPFEFVSENRLSASAFADADTVIAPDLQFVSETHVGVLQHYVEQGGILICSGQFAIADNYIRAWGNAPELGRVVAGIAPAGNTSMGKGAIIVCPQLDQVVERVAEGKALLNCPDILRTPQVRVAAYTDPGAHGKRLIVHAVNYNVPLGVDPPAFEAISDGVLQLPAEFAGRVASVTAYSPEWDGAKSIDPDSRGGGMAAVLPVFRIYTVVEITLQ